MNSLILQTATRFLITLLLLVSFFFLFRGHNEPGGGFIGGLVAAAAYALHAIAFGPAATRRALRIDPRFIVGVGLTVAIVSGLLAALQGQPFLTGQWTDLTLGGVEKLAVGSPVLFDVGVFLVVTGTVTMIILALEEED